MRRRLAAALAAGLACGPGSVRALDRQIDDVGITEALVVAGRSEAARDAFHGRYVITIGDPTHDRVEVIGEFRRVVLTGAERLAFDRRWSVPQAREALAPYRGLVSIVAWIRFPPQNLLVSVPPYGVVVYPDGRALRDGRRTALRPASQSITALYPAGGGLALTGPPGGAMGGIRLEALFPADALPLSGVCTVGLLLGEVVEREVDVGLGGVR